MTYVLFFSSKAVEIMSSIYEPRWRILVTIIISFVTIYWYATIAFVYYGDDFNQAVTGSNQTLRKTLVLIFDAWHNAGLGGFLADNGSSAVYRESDDEKIFRTKDSRLAYDFSFFFIVTTLLFSILSGVIIDNFGEKRATNDSIADKQSERCFICDVNSSDLLDFENHYKYKHNIWDYLFYIGYLREMDENQRTDFRDIHAYNCLQEGKNYWFPVYKEFAITKARDQRPKDILGEVIEDSTTKRSKKKKSSEDYYHNNSLKMSSDVKEKVVNLDAKFGKENKEMKESIHEIKEMIRSIQKEIEERKRREEKEKEGQGDGNQEEMRVNGVQ